MFFFERNNQNSFGNWWPCNGESVVTAAERENKSFFACFFAKKEAPTLDFRISQGEF